MRDIMKKFSSIILIGIISVVLFYGCAGSGVKPDSAGIRIKGVKERFVTRTYGWSGDYFFTYKWCGNKGLVFRSERLKVGIIDIKTGKRIPLKLTMSDNLLNCTPDGKKLFYMDDASRRDGDPIKKIDIELAPSNFLWRGGIVEDMYLYDIEIHKKTLIASVQGLISEEPLSPDGKKLLLGNRHRLTIRKGGFEEWETVRFAREKYQSRAIWFPDSSGVISSGKGATNILCVEFFGKDGWDRCFKQEGDMLKLRVDREGGIYYLEGSPLAGQHRLWQCVIKDREVTCQRMFEKYDVFHIFDFLPGGDIIFEDNNNDLCVHRSTPEGKVDECVINVGYDDSLYNSVSIIGVSPDGRWLAFRRGVKPIIYEGKRRYGGQDLFVIELKDN
jgi:hypothetical protein